MKVTSFKDFILRGNVVDLAIGVIIGAAFNKIISSMVEDIVMPPISLISNKVCFSNWFLVLYSPIPHHHFNTLEAAKKAGAVTLNFGNFITVTINFLIIAFCVYLIIILFNKIRTTFDDHKAEVEKYTKKPCPFCRSSIDIQATKCPNCTSDLPTPPAEEI